MKTDVSAYLKSLHVLTSIVATAYKSEDDKEPECTNNPSYEVMRLHRPTPSQTGSDERENDVRFSDTYVNVD